VHPLEGLRHAAGPLPGPDRGEVLGVGRRAGQSGPGVVRPASVHREEQFKRADLLDRGTAAAGERVVSTFDSFEQLGAIHGDDLNAHLVRR